MPPSAAVIKAQRRAAELRADEQVGGMDQVIEAERARLRSILGSEWAAFDAATAANLALRTSMPAEQAVELLRTKEMSYRRGLFAEAMGSVENPTVGADPEHFDETAGPSPAYPHGMTGEEALVVERILRA